MDKLVNDISPFQKAVLYPSKNEQNLQKTLETDVDISLWTVVARKLLKPEVVGKFDWKSEPSADQREWFHDVCRVRDVRNYLAHLPRPRVTQEEFIERWVELTGALIRLGGDEKLIRSYLGQDFHGMQPEYITTNEGVLRLMRRAQWGARDPVQPLQPFDNVPARYAIISHCVYTKRCRNTYECCMQVANIQRYHIDDRKFDDIAYNYLVSNDGIVYEGRGSDYISSTALGWNSVSIGIAYLGQYISGDGACQEALTAMRLLLVHLVCLGKLQPNYILYGLRQVRPMHDAPKADLYNDLNKWPEWREYEPATRAN
jgi:N-acetylmuramoyl-L-alanine amidase